MKMSKLWRRKKMELRKNKHKEKLPKNWEWCCSLKTKSKKESIIIVWSWQNWEMSSKVIKTFSSSWKNSSKIHHKNFSMLASSSKISTSSKQISFLFNNSFASLLKWTLTHLLKFPPIWKYSFSKFYFNSSQSITQPTK